MIKDIFHSIAAAGRKLFANWGALLISFALYAGSIPMLYLFIKGLSLATNLEVFLHLPVAVAAILLLFALQAMGLSYVRIGVGAGYLLKRALRDCLKIMAVSLPVLLLAWLIVYLFGKIDQSYFIASSAAGAAGPKLKVWGAVAVSAAQIFLLYCLLPLIAIHLWIVTVREGMGTALKGFGHAVVRALAPRSILIYTLVCAVTGGIVYFLLFKKIMFKGEWTELWAVGIKTALALLMVFLGWLLTLGSIAEMTARRAMKEL
jgi:hypothetical protein